VHTTSLEVIYQQWHFLEDIYCWSGCVTRLAIELGGTMLFLSSLFLSSQFDSNPTSFLKSS
jgi:hypothetical protein